MNKVNSFPALTALFPLVLRLNLFTAFEATLLTNLGNLSLAKRIARSVTTILPNLFKWFLFKFI